MSDIEDDLSDIMDEDYIDDELDDDEEIIKKDDDDEDNDMNDDDDDEILKKQFELEQEEHHTENNDLINIVPANERITSEKLSDYETAEIINYRALCISKGGKVFTNVEGLDNPIEMAKKELIDRKCPLYIKRTIGCNNKGELFVEKWSPNECVFNVKLNE